MITGCSASPRKRKKISKSTSSRKEEWEDMVKDAAMSNQAMSTESSPCLASEDDDDWEHLSDFTSDSDNSSSDWTPF